MRKLIYILSIAGVIASCNNQQATEATEQAAVSTDTSGTNYLVDPTTSMLDWKATKKGGSGHNGTIKVSEGNLNVKEGNIVSGSFGIDMKTIVNLDLTDAKSNSDLVGHLSSADFFDAEKYPKGKFDITSVKPLTNDTAGNTHMVSGNLTIKDSVKNISFPAKVVITENEVSAEGEVVINRLQWGITYNSVSASPAALLKKLGDNAINDELTIRIHLKAKKG
jgi:polyisoprenoid-binding protein YceI